MRKLPSLIVVFNRRNTATENHKASVELCITWNRKQKYISSGISIYKNQWKEGFIVNTPDAKQLNAYIQEITFK